MQSLAAEYCHNPPSPSNPTRLLFEINDNNELWFNYETIQPNEVNYKNLKFLNSIERDYKRFIVRYKVSPQSNNMVIEKVLQDIIEAYLEFSTSLFQEEYGKSINKAFESELDDFKRKHGMLILFDDIDWFRVPPPPPKPPKAPVIEDPEGIEIEFK